jgi:hypothetical protein
MADYVLTEALDKGRLCALITNEFDMRFGSQAVSVDSIIVARMEIEDS